MQPHRAMPELKRARPGRSGAPAPWLTGWLVVVALIHPAGRGALEAAAGPPVADATTGSRTVALPAFDFGVSGDGVGWVATHDLAGLDLSPTGLVARITGSDPYFTGPARDYPTNVLLWMHVRLRSDVAGTAQVFYFADQASEEQSVRFPVPDGVWYDTRVPLPAMGRGFRLRFDPPGTVGRCVLAGIRFEARVIFQPPSWPRPGPPDLGEAPRVVRSGRLSLAHGDAGLGQFEVRVDDRPMAAGFNRALAGYRTGARARWLALGSGPDRSFTLTAVGSGVEAALTVADEDGGRWTFRQTFRPGPDDVLRVTTRVTVDQEREAVYLPLLVVLPGLGTFGTNKHQALLAGVEYLENEPSSSEADVRGPASRRQIPAAHQLTMPLMALEQGGRYLALCWEPQAAVAALFDSPDRLFGSSAHVMGLIAPGSVGSDREPGRVMPYEGIRLRPDEPLILEALLLAGAGQSVVPAVEQYVALHPLPPVPAPGLSAVDYFRLAARGWLDSKIREGSQYRHAFWPGFGAQPAADAALWMDWLAPRVMDEALKRRLEAAAVEARGAVDPSQYYHSGLGHVRFPASPLVYGNPLEGAGVAARVGRERLGRFQGEGVVRYEPPARGPDYSSTHGSREANGLVGAVVAGLLEDAAFSGDTALRSAALRHLRALERFRDTVPRGAQTWEIPLHTPDILAAAHLVRAYVLGYELTGERRFLDEARYWAWTGVPFVYLVPPPPGPVGLYNTIAVLGATGWVAPFWIGLPVQWCGLVYGQALYELAPHDPQGPWRRLADGIAVAGVQHTWPVTDVERQGLLPDSFVLGAQLRDGPAINPATVLSQALRWFDALPVYDRAAFPQHGWIVHAAGGIDRSEADPRGVRFRVRSWVDGESWLLVTGLARTPSVRINGAPVSPGGRLQLEEAAGRLALRIPPEAEIALGLDGVGDSTSPRSP